MSPPMKSNLSNEQLKEIVLHILKFGEGERDWWLKYLEINTGLDNLTDYIFYPDLIGLDFDATLEQIADKNRDRKQQHAARYTAFGQEIALVLLCHLVLLRS